MQGSTLFVMQSGQAKTSPKYLQLESPKRSYDSLLLNISDNLREKDKDDFVFAFRSDLPKSLLEVRKPLSWFMALEERDMLSQANLSKLHNFFLMVSLKSLSNQVVSFQSRRCIIVFFQTRLEEKMPGLCLDEKFNQNWMSNQSLPKNFQKRSRDLFRGVQGSREDIFTSLLEKGVTLLVNSCQAYSHDLDSIAMKVLYLSDLFFKRFDELVIGNNHLRKRLSSGFSSMPDVIAEERPPALPPDPAIPQVAERREIDWFEAVVSMALVCIGLLKLFQGKGNCTR